MEAAFIIDSYRYRSAR